MYYTSFISLFFFIRHELDLDDPNLTTNELGTTSRTETKLGFSAKQGTNDIFVIGL